MLCGVCVLRGEEKYPLDDTLPGNVSKYVPQASTRQKEGLQMTRDIWNDEERVEFQETGGFEARRPPDISGRWCGTATTVGDFGSPGQQDRLPLVCTKVLCGTPEWAGCGASSLLCAVSLLGQDCRLKLPSPAQY